MNTYRKNIREAHNRDCDQIIHLIDQVLREWNDRVCLEDSEKDLTDVEGHYWNAGGAFFVLESDAEIIGSHGILPVNLVESICTFKRLYVDQRFRGTGVGWVLMDWNIERARQMGFQKIEFWSDTRFERAHRFFSKFGFVKSNEKREMHDSHDVYWEYHFSMEI